MKKIRFSFVIPTYNEGRYLEDCLRSIRNQTRGDYEIIVADSRSGDNTRKIAKKYGAKIVLDERRGPGSARNKGAKAAKGGLLIFTDADVRFEKDFLEKIDSRFEKGVGGCIFFLMPYDAPSASLKFSYTMTNYIAMLLTSLGSVMTAGSCFAYRKDVFTRAGGFNPEFLTNEDHDLAKRSARIMPFRFFKDITVYTSCRRVVNKGFIKMTWTYTKSSMVFFLNRGYLRDYWKD